MKETLGVRKKCAPKIPEYDSFRKQFLVFDVICIFNIEQKIIGNKETTGAAPVPRG